MNAWNRLKAEDELLAALRERLDNSPHASDAQLWCSNTLEALMFAAAKGGDQEGLLVEELSGLIVKGDLDGVRRRVQAEVAPGRRSILNRLGEEEAPPKLQWNCDPPDYGHRRIQVGRDLFHNHLDKQVKQYFEQAWPHLGKTEAVEGGAVVAPCLLLCPGPGPTKTDVKRSGLPACGEKIQPQYFVQKRSVRCSSCGSDVDGHALLVEELRQALAMLFTTYAANDLLARRRMMSAQKPKEDYVQLGIPGGTVPLENLEKRRGKASSTRGRAPDPARLHLFGCLDAVILGFDSEQLHAAFRIGWPKNTRIAFIDLVEQFTERVWALCRDANSLESDKLETKLPESIDPRDPSFIARTIKKAKGAFAEPPAAAEAPSSDTAEEANASGDVPRGDVLDGASTFQVEQQGRSGGR